MHPTIGKCLMGFALTSLVVWRAWVNICLARSIRQIRTVTAISILLIALVFALCGCSIAPRGPIVSHTIRQFQGRADGLVRYEQWEDDAFTRGYYLCADPAMQSVNAWHTNQAALGGCSHFSAGSVTITVDTNTASIIGAGGTAAGNIIGAAAKTAVK